MSHILYFLFMIERRRYNSGGNRPKLNGSKPPFNLDEWLETIDPGGWMDEDKPNGETRRINQDGIMRVAAARGKREYLTMMLSSYYSPRDLYYKTIDELSDMLNMHLTETGGLI